MLPPTSGGGGMKSAVPAINLALKSIAKQNAPSTATPSAVSPTVVPKVGGQNFIDYLKKSNESSQVRRQKGFDALSSILSAPDPTVPVGATKSTLGVGTPSGSNVTLSAKDTSIASPSQFATSLLKGLGIAPNANNVKAIQAWAQAEGGHWHNTASYNPLNTTQGAAGASSMNKVGVKAYKDWAQGLQATLQTLNNGRYGNILQALKSGSAYDIAHAIANSPWGTGSGVIRVLGG